MIVRRYFTPTAVFIVLTLLGGCAAERWSRQISNSEWIPLANPGTASAQLSRVNAESGLLSSGTHLSNPVQTLALPPALQHQYQEQLVQLQKTQESIQKLLLLQQQLKAQQQLLQTQTFLPGDYSTEDEKQMLPPSSLGNLQTTPELTSEGLVPPHPASEALPPVHPPQNFLHQRPGQVYQNQELSSLPVQSQVILQHGQSDGNVENAQEGPHAYITKQGSHRPDGKRLKGQPSPGLLQSSQFGSVGDEEEEVQLVYVPAETLAQRGQPKRVRGRKQYPVRQQHHQLENQGIDQTSPDQETFARQVLQQFQKEHEEKEFLKEERVKEFARLNEEQKALERKARLQQEALQREQELLRQKEVDKKRKELERLEEMTRQRELDRIREAREKQRQEELERRRLSELRAKEERRREEETRQREEKLELEQRILESQQEDQLRATSPSFQNAQSQALIREQARRQHSPDGTRIKKIRGRQRPRVNQYQEQSNYHREVTTTPSPNQPPLSVYMGGPTSRLDTVKITDVLRLLRNAKTIAVLDNVGPNSPQVFVGPSNLDPPYGYAKFDLPYLSSIDHNRVERKVDKLPFFVAPLSFDPPPGYSKIPFPAPHIGSVVVNNLSEASSTPTNEHNPNPTPLIEPNSYSDADQSGSIATTASYDSSTTQNFSPESSSPKYDPAYSTPVSNSKFRYRQYYDNKPTSGVVSTSYYEQSTAKTKPKHYFEEETQLTTQTPRIDTTPSYRQEVVYSSTPNFQDRSVSPHDHSTKEQELAAQLALINHELVEQREPQKYSTAEQYHSQSNLGESYDANDVRAPVGSMQYNLPAELPPISPHLPGLVNSLLDKQEGNLPVAPTPPPTTTTTTTPTTTTTRINSTTYRPRGRGRIVPTRARTTQAPSNRTERTRRPAYNRSKSRFTTTTEDYRESSYEPTKEKMPETTQKYNTNPGHRRPASRTQKYRSRDRANSQSAGYSQSNASPDSPPSGPASDFQKETPPSGMSNYPENYPTTPMQTENYPLRDVTVQHNMPLVPDDYSRNQNYQQHRPQETRYQHQDATYDQNDGSVQHSELEKSPVNGFNYQVANENLSDQMISQRPKEYPRYQEEANYNLATTVDPRVTPGEEHRYSPIYEVNVAQTQPDYNPSKIESTVTETDSNTSPIFIPLQNKQEDYELQTESTLIETTTTSTTTPSPVIIRQRVRARLGGRIHDSAIQTRPRGSQDEYVRFSAVNNDSGRSGAGHRHSGGSRTRTRARPQSHGSQVQTEGNEYIKIHAAQQQKLVATTVPPVTTTTTARTVEEDVDYGFIRPPNFQPLHPVHPVDTRFQAPVTYRPALSEIQHILPNDETAVESSPSHILKNRQKYHQTSNRRPSTNIFTTTTTSTTTESVPVATAMPDDAVYTPVKSKTKSDEPKSTRVRGRIRRPGKKLRITTTTESGLEANNELPLDENYPRITPQQLPVTASGQQPLYDDNFDVAPQYVPNQNRPAQFYEENSENYPPQEFLLNFGNLPEQVSQREEYDQTELAAIPPRKYSHSGSVSTHSTGDIYGAESQWSTKLSKTSFQPSFSNRVPSESKRDQSRTGNNQENKNAPEIITAGPEVSSVTVIVSSDTQKQLNDADNVGTMMDGFGWKTNAQDHTERLNTTTAVTNSPTTVLQDQTQSDKETLPEWRNQTSSKNERQMDDSTRVTKPASLPGRKTRRRKVRVRVKPVVDDFVTAESQHYNSAVNSLVQDQYKYNPIRESRFTTAQPIATTVTAGTAQSVAESTKKSLLQDFLEEMLKNDEVSIPTRVTSITTESPDWTISTPMTTPMTTPYVLSDDGEVTTLNYTPADTTLIPNIDEERVTKVNENSNGLKDESQEGTSEGAIHLSRGEAEVQKEAKSKKYKNSQEDKSEQNNLENVEVFNQRYNLPSNYPDGSGISNKDEDSITKLTGFPAAKENVRKLSAIGKEKEHIMTLKRQENIEDNQAHPKNHRTKWSEVRYLSAFDEPQTALNSYSTTPIPGVVTRDEGDGSVRTLSDYVKAIFDSMKNAEGGEEVARVIEAKSETDNYNSNETVPAHATSAKESEEIDQKAGTTNSPQDISVTQRVEIEESGTRLEEAQEATTKDSAVTTPISETIANTVPFEPSTTTAETPTRQTINIFRTNSTMLGKVLRTSTTTKVSHMTEICYRGRCVMTKPKMEDILTVR